MDYEKKYKEALERARQFSEHPLQEDSDSIVEYIFPELKESEVKEVQEPTAMAEEIIVNLKRVEQDYHIDLTREMEWLRNKVQKGDSYGRQRENSQRG